MSVLADPSQGKIAYTSALSVGWAATDANAHMRGTAYLDAVNDARMHFLHEHGWPLERFILERIGPVLLREEVVYRRELRLGDTATIDVSLVDQTPNGDRFTLHNVIRRDHDNAIAFAVTSRIAWINLDHRKLARPPDDLRALIAALPAQTSCVIAP